MTTAEKAPEERREHPRLSIAIEVSFQSDSQLYAGLTGDVSRGGVFMPTYQPIAVGTETDIELALPNGQLVVRGVVRWRREGSDDTPPGIGIQFLDMSDEARALLDALCKSYAPLYYDDLG